MRDERRGGDVIARTGREEVAVEWLGVCISSLLAGLSHCTVWLTQ